MCKDEKDAPTCPVCGGPIKSGTESNNGGVHKDCDPENEEESDE